jgi:stage V sporulation protein G
MQVAIIKSYSDEKERARMPGYVCTYDDYDGGDMDYDQTPSYGAVVAGGRVGYRTHGGHQPAARGTHLGQDKGAAATKKTDDGFGAGM